MSAAESWTIMRANHGKRKNQIPIFLGWSMGQKAMAIDPTQHFGFAMLLSVHGKKQEAIDQLELAIENGYHNYIWIKIHVDFQPLYDEPRFKELIRRSLKQ